MRYIALLRGVNVGGRRRVPRDMLQKVLEQLGFLDVQVYINSGNAIFTSRRRLVDGEVQRALEEYFGFSIPTLVLSAQKIKLIAESIPSEWTNDAPKPDKSGQKSDVLYLFDEVNTPDVLQRLGYNPEVETMIYVDGAVLANVTRVNQMKGSLQNLAGTGIYDYVTIRNVNTARKLAELAKEHIS